MARPSYRPSSCGCLPYHLSCTVAPSPGSGHTWEWTRRSAFEILSILQTNSCKCGSSWPDSMPLWSRPWPWPRGCGNCARTVKQSPFRPLYQIATRSRPSPAQMTRNEGSLSIAMSSANKMCNIITRAMYSAPGALLQQPLLGLGLPRRPLVCLR